MTAPNRGEAYLLAKKRILLAHELGAVASPKLDRYLVGQMPADDLPPPWVDAVRKLVDELLPDILRRYGYD